MRNFGSVDHSLINNLQIFTHTYFDTRKASRLDTPNPSGGNFSELPLFSSCVIAIPANSRRKRYLHPNEFQIGRGTSHSLNPYLNQLLVLWKFISILQSLHLSSFLASECRPNDTAPPSFIVSPPHRLPSQITDINGLPITHSFYAHQSNQTCVCRFVMSKICPIAILG